MSVSGKPLLYHLFDRFPQTNFITIGDRLYEVLEKYLDTIVPSVPVKLIRAKEKGTLGGVKEALTLLPDDDVPFLLIWSDLLFEKIPDIEITDRNVIGLSRSFKCRWSYSDTNVCQEEPSSERGIAGFFMFQNRRCLGDIPASGECVRWLAKQRMQFDVVFLDDVYEIGTLDALSKYQRTCKAMTNCCPE
ncbi:MULTISPECIES: hypothetical protein [Aerosakkonema]|uniref:hypothetical protein n=1 Tax=Aerosakkonema TaxID=1246629 RepID=UPI0035B8E64F